MEKTVAVDAAKRYTVWEFKDAAKEKRDNDEILKVIEKTKNDLDGYRILNETGLMVSLYDIIDWFNKEYLKIKKEAEALPKIELEIDKWELGKKERVLFNFLRCSKQTIAFTEDPINLNEIFHRTLTIQDDLQNPFFEDKVTEDERYSLVLKYLGVCWNVDKKIEGLDQNVMRQYRLLVDKYYNYLQAYTHFITKSNRLSKAIFNNDEQTTINAGIYGKDPFRNLKQFAVGFGQGGNEPAYFFTYNLGTETLEKPIFRFQEKFLEEYEVLDKDDLVNNNYHEVAKTLKLCKTYLPFEITSSK